MDVRAIASKFPMKFQETLHTGQLNGMTWLELVLLAKSILHTRHVLSSEAVAMSCASPNDVDDQLTSLIQFEWASFIVKTDVILSLSLSKYAMVMFWSQPT